MTVHKEFHLKSTFVRLDFRGKNGRGISNENCVKIDENYKPVT